VLQATTLASLGDFAAAERSLSDSAAIALETGRPYDQVAIAYGTGYAALLQGRTAEATTVVQPLMNLVKQQDIVFFQPVLGNLLGQALVAGGKHADGLLMLKEALRVATDLSYVGARLGISLSLGVAHLASGDVLTALPLIEACLENARQQGYRSIHANAARYFAIANTKLGRDAGLVRRLLDESIEISTEIEAQPSAAIARLTLAELLTKGPEYTLAAPLLATVTAEFERMGMEVYFRRAQQALGELRRSS
jgi:tetratricopeptide (TPR) repeat protein